MSNRIPVTHGGLSAKKSLGQHWLTDSATLEAMADLAGVEQDSQVIEIGPGHGSLTAVLLDKGAIVSAVEYDDSLAGALISSLDARTSRAPDPVAAKNLLKRLTVIHQDVLQFNFETCPAEYRIAANIPYYLTSHLLRILSELNNKPIVAALLVQKEVAERVGAQAGSMGIISVALQAQYDIDLGMIVPARLFSPPPKVDSMILVLKRKQQPIVPNDEFRAFMRVVKAGFSAKRKQLANTLSGGLHIPKDQARDLLAELSITDTRRAEELTLDEWQQMYCLVRDKGLLA